MADVAKGVSNTVQSFQALQREREQNLLNSVRHQFSELWDEDVWPYREEVIDLINLDAYATVVDVANVQQLYTTAAEPILVFFMKRVGNNACDIGWWAQRPFQRVELLNLIGMYLNHGEVGNIVEQIEVETIKMKPVRRTIKR